MKTLTEEEWLIAGELSKKINNDLNKLIELTSRGMGKSHTDPLRKSSNHLNKFRSNAEELMFRKGLKNIKVFY